jgi:FkbH-like protein
MWYLARAPLSAHALPALAASMALFLRAAFGPPRKCLVVDLDNTLWGGVLGEQGVEGIQVGFTYPGNVYRRFQQTLLSLRRRGVLLAIASKNNPEEVEEVFRTHPDMVLREQHFSAARVNWRDKPENVLEIAAELNIAPSSLVFFDDSPVECARMRDALPEVLTVQAPRDVLDYLGALRRSGAFERLTFTAEDQQRAEMYHQERERKQMQKGAATVEEFLTGLEMGAEIRQIDTFTLPRAVELTQKTNQFNLTTRRYTAPELARAIESPGGAGFCLRLWDRFGDHGIVGLAILQIDGDAARIDTFLLSCRVIGRSAETALLAFIVRWARARGVSTIEGTFVPTARNAPAADFYARHGFSASTAADGSTAWRLPASSDVAWPPAIRAVDGLAEPA